MGRDSGYIALHAGIAGGAGVILLPEVPFSYEPIIKKINQRMDQGRFFCLIVVAEGCVEKNSTEQSFVKSSEGNMLLGGMGQQLADTLHKKTGLSTRYTVLGHIQRGGSPTPADCILATQFGVKAIELIEEGKFGRVVTIKDGRVNCVDYGTIANKRRPVSMDNYLIKTAEGIGISLGLSLIHI